MRTDDLVNALNEVMSSCVERVKKLADDTASAHNTAIDKWRKLNYAKKNVNGYTGPDREDYRDVDFDAYYMVKFGYAYAFEYWVIYDAILRIYTGDPYLGIASVGCGSMIDAWSLAYAKDRMDEDKLFKGKAERLKLRYYGYDGVQWGMYFAGKDMDPDEEDYCTDCRTVVNKSYEGSEPTVFRFEKNIGPDIADVFGGEKSIEINKRWTSYEILMFGKIFNELPADKLEETLKLIEQAGMNGEFTQKEMYICISHNKSGVEKQTGPFGNIGQRIVEAINRNKDYSIDGKVMEYSSLYNRPGGIVLMNNSTDELHKFYIFQSIGGAGDDEYGKMISELNPHFAGKEVANIYSQVENTITQEIGRAKRMTRTSSLAMQVIKLKKKGWQSSDN